MTLFKEMARNIKEEKKYIILPALLLSPILYLWILYSMFKIYEYGEFIPILVLQHTIIPLSISLFISFVILLPFNIVITKKKQRKNYLLTYLKLQFLTFIFVFFIMELLFIIIVIIPTI